MNTVNEGASGTSSSHHIPNIVTTLLADIDGLVFIIGNDFRPVWSSKPDGSLFGRHMSEWEPGTLSASVHPGDQAWLKRNRHEILATPKSSVQGRVRVLGVDGGYSVVTLTATNRFDDPDINGLVITVTPSPDQLPNSPMSHDELPTQTGDLDQREQGRDQPPSPKVTADASVIPAHVLVVDDSEVNRRLATSQLKHLGHTFATAEGSRDAIEMLASNTFDLVLMDWHMPGVDGLEATRQWRSHHDPKHELPIIMMTAGAMTGDRERCLDAGASDYLSKPVSINDLAAMIARWARSAPPPSSVDIG